MSAWIVTHAHIDALVTQMLAEGIIEPAAADFIGTSLWFENHHGVNVRYSEATPTPEYTYEAPEGFNLDLAKVHTLIRCYQYQCAEYDGYDDQPGYLLTEALRAAIEAKIGDPNADRLDGRTSLRGPWGISTLEEAR